MFKLDSATKYSPSLEQLPLIVAGPMLRHTKTDEVTVWLALTKPETIALKVYETESGRGSIIGRMLLEGERSTICLGKNLYVVAVTAKSVEGQTLEPDRVYAYDLYCQHEQKNLVEAIAVEDKDYSLSYFPHQLPTFALSPTDIDDLRIVHGSCRKPHGGGRDTLSCLDNLIQENASLASQRPHQLFLTGDQIYGDDVADSMLWLDGEVNQLLFGWSEELPLQQGTILAEELPPGRRFEIARIEGGMTAMLGGKEDKAKSHLFSFGEYVAAYLLAWSPVLVPDGFPDDSWNKKKRTAQWQHEIDEVSGFVRDLSSVRRALANVTVYTICDDHDVSDDFYLNREWCDRVLGKPLGRRIVQNGLLAYAIFQAWGNTPQYFALGTAGEKLLQFASEWLQSKGKNLTAKAECDRYLGIPAIDTATGLPKMELDEDVLVLARDNQTTIPWHYQVYGTNHEVIVLDTRTWRGYPPETDKNLAPPMLLSHYAFKQQLTEPLKARPPHIKVTAIVLPTNLVALGIIDRIQQYELSQDRVFSTDVGDSWNFHEEAFATLLLNLCQQRDRVIILSGDIHYSCAVRLVHWDCNSYQSSIVVQLTSSAIKNSELSTRLVHTKLKSLLPEKNERWLGWNKSLKLLKLDRPGWWRKQSPQDVHVKPDWQYRIEWCKRQPAKSLPWKLPKLNKHKSIWRRLIDFVALLWRNRWLQEGSEVVGRNNISLVRFRWLDKTVIQETYWHPPWSDRGTVKSSYEVSLEDMPSAK